jgi:cytochrome c peroxidase
MKVRVRLRRIVAVLLSAVFGAMATLAIAADAALLDYTPDEVRRILQHGPWPPTPARDPGNAHAADPQAIDLGRRLFFDRRLSVDGTMSCATCHAPAQAFADGRPSSLGRVALDRNAPSLWNAVHERWYGWDGAADSIWSQTIRPLLDPREMAGSAAHVATVVAADRELACRYARAFGRAPAVDDDADAERTLVDVAKAIGAFVGTLVSGRTPFDAFRDALAAGDQRAAARYPLDAQRGLRLFVGRGRCTTCHVGPLFTHGEFGDIGLPFFVRPGQVDPGRHAGIAALRASPFNLLSRHSDAAGGDAALKTRHVEPQHRNFGEFKVPSLRNVADTAPYMHDGQLATLDAVLAHYVELNLDRLHADGEQILQPLRIDAGERADMVAFLKTLSDPEARAWQAPAEAPCRGERASGSQAQADPSASPVRR